MACMHAKAVMASSPDASTGMTPLNDLFGAYDGVQTVPQFFARCVLSALCCVLSAVCCLLSAVCCLSSALCSLLTAVYFDM
jgi:hypothetical protein